MFNKSKGEKRKGQKWTGSALSEIENESEFWERELSM